jgi:hypothetical protein
VKAHTAVAARAYEDEARVSAALSDVEPSAIEDAARRCACDALPSPSRIRAMTVLRACLIAEMAAPCLRRSRYITPTGWAVLSTQRMRAAGAP